MRGFMIYETPAWGDEENVVYTQEVNNASYTLKQVGSDDITCYMEGMATKDPVTKATCNKDDEYDFEIGALISLMKKCGVDKVVRACNEAFSEDTFKTYATKYERELNELKKEVKRLNNVTEGLYGFNRRFIDEIDQKNLEIISLKSLKLSNESLKEENKNLNASVVAKEALNRKLLEENSQLKYIKSCNESTIGSLENTRDLLTKENERLEDSREQLLNESIHRLNKELNLKKEYVALKAENEKLKTDCEKLQHGYNVMVFCGGRQNGKQYTALVELFKKIDQKKVDAAYKEAYNTTLPVWQKEVLNQLYGFHKEAKEKIELPRTLDINGTVYRKSIQIKDFGEEITKLAEESSTKPVFKIDRGVMITGWDPEKDFVSQINECLGICKPVSKRERMWDEILKEGRTPVYVKREDIHNFLEECQILGIKWSSGKMPMETMPFRMSDGCDGVYFFVMTSLDISKSKKDAKEFRHLMSWWTTASDEEARNSIKYIRPMRWDLFKKGRLVVKLNPDNYKEFYEKCEAVMGKKPMSMVTGSFTVYHDKSGTFHIRPYDDKFLYTHKVVDWEDVR